MNKFCLILISFCIAFASDARANQYEYFIKVKIDRLYIYSKPSYSAAKVAAAKKDQLLQMVGKQNGWLKLKIPTSKRGYVFGWVEQSSRNYQLFRKTMKQSGASATPKSSKQRSATGASNAKEQKKAKKNKPAKKKSAAKQGEHAFRSTQGLSARLLGGIAYSIKDYFAESGLGQNQIRVGVAADKALTDKVLVSVPIVFSTGEGFSTISLGAQGYFYPLDVKKLMPYAKLGLGYEYLYSGDANFSGVNIDAGIGVDYRISDRIAVGLEPLSIIAMVYRSEDTIPLNVRGQFLLSVRVKW